MRLLIISHTPHFIKNNTIVGWGPTVEEIDHLATLFDHIRHLAPIHAGNPTSGAFAYQSDKVDVVGVSATGGDSIVDKTKFLGQAPRYLQKIRHELRNADVVQVRCPANISLLAILWLSVTNQTSYRWSKYAGNWKPTIPTPLSYTVQRLWLSWNMHRGVVTVNGHWLGQPKHVYSFHNPSLSHADLENGRRACMEKQLTAPLQLLFVGALNALKGIFSVLQIALFLRRHDVAFDLKVIGDGPERGPCETWVEENGFENCIHFYGWLPKTALAMFYSPAHFLLHPTRSDGWPKVLSEAMAFGVVPLAGAVSGIPQVLTSSGAGLALPPQEPLAYGQAILDFIQSPSEWKQASDNGLSHADLFTYRSYQDAVRKMFRDAWGVELKQSSL